MGPNRRYSNVTWSRHDVQRRAVRVVQLAAVGFACAAAPASASTLGSLPCRGTEGFLCSSLPVPLDRANPESGTISLAVERKPAGKAATADAVLMLAGGPGQAAIPFAPYVPSEISAALKTRDLLVMDQRGTGKSAPLGCPAVEKSSAEPMSHVVEQCALQLGSVREAFTTAETVRDIEALRVAAGYQKLVLFGISYGTKVALEYAEQYPQNVESLVLDSVVPTGEEEPFRASTFRAMTPVMDELCARGGCAGVTTDPVRDLASLDARMSRHSLIGAVYDGHGTRHGALLEPSELYGLLLSGDDNPILRAMLPGAVSAALRGDPSPILRLQTINEGLIPTEPESASGGWGAEAFEGGEDSVLYMDTMCEEEPFPWSRTASAATRLSEARIALRHLPAGTFYPFAPTTAFVSSNVNLCSSWPDAGPAPAPVSTLPNVPTLIFSGEQDLRTPTSGALSVAARIPDAQVLRVPFTGHSVVGTDLSGCSAKAMTAFFDGTPLQACNGRNLFPVTEVPPVRLSEIHPPRGLAGRPGRTLVAALDALRDFDYTEIGALFEGSLLNTGSSFGGLHGGYATLAASTVVLHDYAYVPGVFLSGRLPRHSKKRVQPAITLAVTGPRGADGTFTFTERHAWGVLGGQRFDIHFPHSRAAGLGGGQLPSQAEVRVLAARSAASRTEAPWRRRSR